jgi:hypothetical protein
MRIPVFYFRPFYIIIENWDFKECIYLSRQALWTAAALRRF